LTRRPFQYLLDEHNDEHIADGHGQECHEALLVDCCGEERKATDDVNSRRFLSAHREREERKYGYIWLVWPIPLIQKQLLSFNSNKHRTLWKRLHAGNFLEPWIKSGFISLSAQFVTNLNPIYLLTGH
jgi:hypothetical protein